MATGPEHYREAEADRDAAARASDRGREDDAVFWLKSAQVHATLALAAATALHSGGDEMYADDKAAWVTIASEEGKREAS